MNNFSSKNCVSIAYKVILEKALIKVIVGFLISQRVEKN